MCWCSLPGVCELLCCAHELLPSLIPISRALCLTSNITYNTSSSSQHLVHPPYSMHRSACWLAWERLARQCAHWRTGSGRCRLPGQQPCRWGFAVESPTLSCTTSSGCLGSHQCAGERLSHDLFSIELDSCNRLHIKFSHIPFLQFHIPPTNFHYDKMATHTWCVPSLTWFPTFSLIPRASPAIHYFTYLHM